MKSIFSVSTRTLLFQLFVAALLFLPPLPLHADQTICSAVLSPDISFQIPRLTMGDLALYANLQQVPTTDGNIVLKLAGYGVTNRTDCSDRDTAMFMTTTDESAWILHIPSLMIGPGQYWVNLQYVPGENGELWFRVLDYGPGGEWSNEGGMFMALAKDKVLSTSDTSHRLQLAFPAGIEADWIVTLSPYQTYTPTAEELAGASQNPHSIYDIQTTNSIAGDIIDANLSYFVPYSALPAKTAGQFRVSSQVSQQNAASGEQSGIRVVVESVLKAGGKEVLGLLGEKGFKEAGKAFTEVAGSLLDVIEAWDISKEHENWMKKFDALEDCAEHPTNPATQNAYAANPAYKQRILDQLRMARLSLKVDTSMRFINAEANVASARGGPVVGIVASGMAGHSEESIKRISAQEFAWAEQLVTPCDTGYAVNQAYGEGSISGNICSVTNTFYLDFTSSVGLTGKFTFTPFTPASANAGTVAYRGEYGGGLVTNAGNGSYMVALGEDDKPRSIIMPPYVITQCIPAYGCTNHTTHAETVALIPDGNACR